MVVPVLRALGSLAGMEEEDLAADSRRALRCVRSKEKPEGVDVAVGASVNSDIAAGGVSFLIRIVVIAVV